MSEWRGLVGSGMLNVECNDLYIGLQFLSSYISSMPFTTRRYIGIKGRFQGTPHVMSSPVRALAYAVFGYGHPEVQSRPSMQNPRDVSVVSCLQGR